MSPQEMEDFLSEGNVARIATIKPDNSPHITPVWYLWENNQLLIAISKGSLKERNIRKNKKVAVTIDSNTAPNKGVIIEGTAEVEEELGEEIERRICRRYLNAEDLDEYIAYAHANWQSILIRIRPEKIISWDYSKDPFLNKPHSKV